jgi:hypothetical protein
VKRSTRFFDIAGSAGVQLARRGKPPRDIAARHAANLPGRRPSKRYAALAGLVKKEIPMKWTVIASLAFFVATGGAMAQTDTDAKAQTGKNNTQSTTVKNSKNVTREQTGENNKQDTDVANSENVAQKQSGKNNKQSMKVKNSKNVSQTQSGNNNQQSMNVQGNTSNISQSQSGMRNSQSLTIK